LLLALGKQGALRQATTVILVGGIDLIRTFMKGVRGYRSQPFIDGS
jgi:hypothetical protein